MNSNILPKHIFRACLKPLGTWISLKMSSVIIPHFLYSIDWTSVSFGKQFLQTECPHLDKGIGLIKKWLSSDRAHLNFSNYSAEFIFKLYD